MDPLLAQLARWLPGQRWWSRGPGVPRLRTIGSMPLPSDDASAQIRLHLIRDGSDDDGTTYLVPVVTRPFALDPHGVIGDAPDGGVLIDGPHDAAFTRALLRLITASGEQVSPPLAVSGHAAARSFGAMSGSRVLAGEQSNTSIVYNPASDGPGVICKLYRRLEAGVSAEVELHTALSDAGSDDVPTALGWAQVRWRGSGGEPLAGAIAFAQEFVPDVEDAWRVALRAASADVAFHDDAAGLGAAIARMHGALRGAFGVSTTRLQDAATAAWAERLTQTAAEVPEVAALRPGIERVYRRARTATWPSAQRVHGDLHLGQVLHTTERGWLVVDFEGEPLRRLAARRAPDLAARDVAGMLRSFDYVAGSTVAGDPTSADRARRWAAGARGAFLDGYRSAGGDPGPDALMAALELDKAVYECRYEARSRPTWLPIPLDGVLRLI